MNSNPEFGIVKSYPSWKRPELRTERQGLVSPVRGDMGGSGLVQLCWLGWEGVGSVCGSESAGWLLASVLVKTNLAAWQITRYLVLHGSSEAQ